MARRIITGFPGGVRVEALIINAKRILTIHRRNNGEEYWVLPGGGWEDNETEEEGVAREVREETSLSVDVVRPVFFLTVLGDGKKLVYLCQYLGGEPALGNFNEKRDMAESAGTQFYDPQWVNITDLPKIKLYTLEFRDWFLDHYRNGQLPKITTEVTISKSQFRG